MRRSDCRYVCVTASVVAAWVCTVEGDCVEVGMDCESAGWKGRAIVGQSMETIKYSLGNPSSRVAEHASVMYWAHALPVDKSQILLNLQSMHQHSHVMDCASTKSPELNV